MTTNPGEFRSLLRKSYSKLKERLDLPNLIQLQGQSYDLFLQADVPHEKKKTIGLQAVFNSVFPIEDFNGTASLEFDHYSLESPKYDIEECRSRGMTYASPLKITVRLIVYDLDEQTGEKTVRDIKEQEIWLGEIPLMTDSGSFIVNGVERVVVSQLHRSPGVVFNHDSGKSHSSGKLLYSARIIPHRGSWLDFEFDLKDIIYARIDRKRKFPATILLKALGKTTKELLNYYFNVEIIDFSQKDHVFALQYVQRNLGVVENAERVIAS